LFTLPIPYSEHEKACLKVHYLTYQVKDLTHRVKRLTLQVKRLTH